MAPGLMTRKSNDAPYPSSRALMRLSTCLLPLSVGASGNRATPSLTKVHPFTSTKTLLPGNSSMKSTLLSPNLTSLLREVKPLSSGNRPDSMTS